MGTPIVAEVLQIMPSPLKLILFLGAISGAVLFTIPFTGINLFEMFEFLINSAMRAMTGEALPITGLTVLIFLGVPTFFALKFGMVHG